jgi:membrane protein involved in colicin uptake
MADGSSDARKARAEEERKRRSAESVQKAKEALEAAKNRPSSEPSPAKPKKKASGEKAPRKKAATSKSPAAKKAAKKAAPKPKPERTQPQFSASSWTDFIDDFVEETPGVEGPDRWKLSPELSLTIQKNPDAAKRIIDDYDLTKMPDEIQQQLFGMSVTPTEDAGALVSPTVSIEQALRGESRRGAQLADEYDPTDPEYQQDVYTGDTERALREAGGRGFDDPLSFEPGGRSGKGYSAEDAIDSMFRDAPRRPENVVPNEATRPSRRPVTREELEAGIAYMSPTEDVKDDEVMWMDPKAAALRANVPGTFDRKTGKPTKGDVLYGTRYIPEYKKNGKPKIDKKTGEIKYTDKFYHFIGEDDFGAVTSEDPRAIISNDELIKEQYEAAKRGETPVERVAVRVPKSTPLTPGQAVNKISPEVHGPGTRLYAPQGANPVSSGRREARESNAVRGAVGEFIARFGPGGTETTGRPEGATPSASELDENLNYIVRDAEGNTVWEDVLHSKTGEPIVDETTGETLRQPVTRSLFDLPAPEPGERHPSGISRKAYEFLSDTQMRGMMRGSMGRGGVRLGRPAGGRSMTSTSRVSNDPRIPRPEKVMSVNQMSFKTDESGNVNLVHTDKETGEEIVVQPRSDLAMDVVQTARPPADPRDVRFKLRNPEIVSNPETVTETREAPYVDLLDDNLSQTPVITGTVMEGPSKQVTTTDPRYVPTTRRTGQPVRKMLGEVAENFTRDYQGHILKTLNEQAARKREAGEKGQSEGLIAAQTGYPQRTGGTSDWMTTSTENHPLSMLMADIRNPVSRHMRELSAKHGISVEDAVGILRRAETHAALVGLSMRSPSGPIDDRLFTATHRRAGFTPSDYDKSTINVETAEGDTKKVQVSGLKTKAYEDYLKGVNKTRKEQGKPVIEIGSPEEERLWALHNVRGKGAVTKVDPGVLSQQMDAEAQARTATKVEANETARRAAQPSSEGMGEVTKRAAADRVRSNILKLVTGETEIPATAQGYERAAFETTRAQGRAERESIKPDLEAAALVNKRLRDRPGSGPKDVLEGIPSLVPQKANDGGMPARDKASPLSLGTSLPRRGLRTSDISNTGYGMVAKAGVSEAINRRVKVQSTSPGEERLTDDYLSNSLSGGIFSPDFNDSRKRTKENIQRSYRADVNDLDTRMRRQERDSFIGPRRPDSVKELPSGTVNLNPLPPSSTETRTGPTNGGFFGRYRNAPALQKKNANVEEAPAQEAPSNESAPVESRVAPRGGGFFQRVANRGQFNRE